MLACAGCVQHVADEAISFNCSLTPCPVRGQWGWAAGPTTAGYAGQYAGPPFSPSARYYLAAASDRASGSFIFGGFGPDSVGTSGYLNDLWKWNGTAWTWLSGSSLNGSTGTFGTQGVPAVGNVPSARNAHLGWTDPAGQFWLLGGSGFDSVGGLGNLSDMWRWDGTNWTWISGSAVINALGVYGTQGVASGTNAIGGRYSYGRWVDGSGQFWMFGGHGNDSGTVGTILNDLWRWDGVNWTWISGSTTGGATGVYGTKGVPAGANVPGAREGPATWMDGAGNFWLFGGLGFDGVGGGPGNLNDLWRWDGVNWTWMAGAATISQPGNYGTMGIASVTNVPGARATPAFWSDAAGNFWLFGGGGLDSVGANGSLSDLWKWDGANWTWVAGPNVVNGSGTYGTLGFQSATSQPGSRTQPSGWTDAGGRFWLFGGSGYDGVSAAGYLGDLWYYIP